MSDGEDALVIPVDMAEYEALIGEEKLVLVKGEEEDYYMPGPRPSSVTVDKNLRRYPYDNWRSGAAYLLEYQPTAWFPTGRVARCRIEVEIPLEIRPGVLATILIEDLEILAPERLEPYSRNVDAAHMKHLQQRYNDLEKLFLPWEQWMRAPLPPLSFPQPQP